MNKYIIFLSIFFLAYGAFGQQSSLNGIIQSTEDQSLERATIQLNNGDYFDGTVADEEGKYSLENIPAGRYTLEVSLVGFVSIREEIEIQANQETQRSFTLQPDQLNLEQIVVTGTRTFKRKTDSPVMVNIIDAKTLGNVQACNLAEGLRFQPGLRVESNCQTCNYTQLRMNGLGGGYSQILINGRPIFSPLTGLYGMEQLPVNMIERIEVVRGGGSALYGSSAIGGTVNVITRIPRENNFDLGYTFQSINGGALDHQLLGNATLVNDQQNAGISFFINHRNREWYDHNGDNFSELPELKTNAFGTNLFFQPSDNQKLELSFSYMNEYRYGGEMVDQPAHLTQQAEERTHRVWMGNLDYQINFNQDNSSLIAYLAGQYTDRDHYTGIFPDDSLDIIEHLTNPPYGISEVTTLQAGVQVNHRFQKFPLGPNVFTLGAEYLYDDVLDTIEAYRYQIDQTAKNFGVFLQSDWELIPNLTLLTGVRADQHNLVDRLIFSPRVSLLYQLGTTTQFRATWGTGFRAPQAFDTDLHIAFAGGGISRISLDPDLKEERSESISGSINFDKATEKFVAGFTVEGFHTRLRNAFYLQPLGEDEFGERFEKRNGPGATVQGATLELRANFNRKAQLEAGFTLQTSLFDEPVENIDGLEPLREFLRTPNEYGFAILTITPWKSLNAVFNLVYTGPMEVAHFAGAPEQEFDTYVTTRPFTELSVRIGYTFSMKKFGTGLELFGGIKNLTNAFQSDFDTGKNRDSNYVYGPVMPRTVFAGLRLGLE